jgi:hypothetical protein
MTSLAATLLDVPTPNALKASTPSYEEAVRRDDVFFSLMQEPSAPTSEKEQEPSCEAQRTSKDDLCKKNEEACGLEKADTGEKKDLLTPSQEDTPLEGVAFPRSWKDAAQVAKRHDFFQDKTKIIQESFVRKSEKSLVPGLERERGADLPALTQKTLGKTSDLLKTDTFLPTPGKNIQEDDLRLDKMLSPLKKEGASPENDFLKIAPQIAQKENVTPLLFDKKPFEKIEKQDDLPSTVHLKDVRASLPQTEPQNTDRSADNLAPFNLKTQDKDFVLSQKETLPFSEGLPGQKTTPSFEQDSIQKTSPDMKEKINHKTSATPNHSLAEGKSLSNTQGFSPLAFEKNSSFDATEDVSQDFETHLSPEVPVDKKAPTSEILSPLQKAKPQESASEMSAYRAVSLDIKMPSKEAPGTLKLRLDPANLGRVEVKVHITHDGRMDAVVSVVRSETFELLQKDASVLHKTIAEAFGQDESAMSFTLTGGEKGSSQDSFGEPDKGARPDENLDLATSERALTYAPKPLDPARMLDALV